MTLDAFLREFGTSLSGGISLLGLGVVFVAGVVASAVCPCTLPVGLGMASAAGASEVEAKKSGMKIAAAFFTGIVINLTLLGVLAGRLGALATERFGRYWALGMAVLSLAAAAVAFWGPHFKVSKLAGWRRPGLTGAFGYGFIFSLGTSVAPFAAHRNGCEREPTRGAPLGLHLRAWSRPSVSARWGRGECSHRLHAPRRVAPSHSSHQRVRPAAGERLLREHVRTAALEERTMAMEMIQIKASGMMCSFCTMSVEKALKKLPGAQSVLCNLVHGVILVEADTQKTSKKTLADAVNALGYPVSETQQQQLQKDQAFHKMVRWRGLLGMGLAAVDVLVDPVNIFGLPAQPRAIFSLALALFVLIWVGKPVLVRALAAACKGVINANVLLSTATWGSLVVGALSIVDPRWPNFLPVATWLMALHIFSNYFKLGTNLKAAEAVRGLLSLQPPRARVLRGGTEVDVDVQRISKGETVMVRPGERIPLDGEVARGRASVDESSFTGESVPVAKEKGSAVIGGTLNLDGALEIVVTKVGEDSFLSQLVRLMSQVSDRKVPLELLADRLMNYYGPVVLVLGGLALVAWGIATQDVVLATTIALATVIMGYPCALGMTTPMLAAIAGGKGITIGLLVKSGEVFHQLDAPSRSLPRRRGSGSAM